MNTKISKTNFGTVENKEVFLFTLSNINGVTVKIANFGGIITSITTPDKHGTSADITLGFDTLEGYLSAHPFFGCLVGRFANRIAEGKFSLNGTTYPLFINNGPNSLHGGKKGFDKVVWEAKEIESNEGAGIELYYISKDMEEGYPGNLSVTVQYILIDNGSLKISYSATTDKATPINLTNHAYFNLNGCTSTVLQHVAQINAREYTPTDEVQIPTGEIKSVVGTPFDFTTSKPIGQDSLLAGGGYDHNYVLNNPKGNLVKAATVSDPHSGRKLEVFTTEPGIQFYTGNFLDGSVNGRHGIYNKHAGFCLEAQHYPDSPNRSSFPSTILMPGQTYSQVTVYKFS